MQDSFTRCFKSNAPEPWNWNVYLFPLWVMGVAVRYLILFPIRFDSPSCHLLFSIDEKLSTKESVSFENQSAKPIVFDFFLFCFSSLCVARAHELN